MRPSASKSRVGGDGGQRPARACRRRSSCRGLARASSGDQRRLRSGCDDTMANSNAAMKTRGGPDPARAEDWTTDRARPAGTMIAAARTALRSLPQRSVRAAEVVGRGQLEGADPERHADRPIRAEAELVLEPGAERDEQRLRRRHQAEHRRPRRASRAAGMRPLGAGRPARCRWRARCRRCPLGAPSDDHRHRRRPRRCRRT